MNHYELGKHHCERVIRDTVENRNLLWDEVLILLNDEQVLELKTENRQLKNDNQQLTFDYQEMKEERDVLQLQLDEISELVGPGGDDTPVGRVESLLSNRTSGPWPRLAYVGRLERAATEVLRTRTGWFDAVNETLAGKKFSQALSELYKATKNRSPTEQTNKIVASCCSEDSIENELRRQEKNEKQAEIDACLPSSRLREDTEYVEELNNLVVRLNVRSHHLVDKLVRIVKLIPPMNDSPILDAIKVIAFESMPPNDSIATAEGEMLQEIDKLLMDAGVWVNNRLDSIRHLIRFYMALKNIMNEEEL